NNFQFLSSGKIRGSYGVVGNEPLSDYQYLNLWGPSGLTYQGNGGLSTTRLFNADYRWEENKKFDAGLELGFMKDRFTFCLDYYRNRTVNQIVGYPLPPTTGFSSIPAYNLPAIVQNTGVEIELTTTNIRN